MDWSVSDGADRGAQEEKGMKRFLMGAAVLGLMAIPAMADRTIIAPMQGSLGNPFNNVQGGAAGGVVGNLYDNILTINGGAATAGTFGLFDVPGGQAYVDWSPPNPGEVSFGQWGDDLHGLAGPALGGPTAVITSIRYGYLNTVATATHSIQIYEMLHPTVSYSLGQNDVSDQFGARLTNIVLTGMAITDGAMVTVTGLSVHVGTAAWITFGESGLGFDNTRWLSGGIANGVGTSQDGVLYRNMDSADEPHQFFLGTPYFDFGDMLYVGPNIQVALGGFVLPAPAVISLLGLGGLVTLRRRRFR